jgi:hypothetical protein
MTGQCRTRQVCAPRLPSIAAAKKTSILIAEIALSSRTGDTAFHFFPAFFVLQTRFDPVKTVFASAGSIVT